MNTCILALCLLTYAQWHVHELVDEPDFPAWSKTPAQVHQAYRQAPHGFWWVTFVNCRDAVTYRGSFDGLAFDDYPFYARPYISNRAALAEWYRTVRTCAAVAHRLHVPLTSIVQGFAGHDGPFRWRRPPQWAFRRMVTFARRFGHVVVFTHGSGAAA